MKRQAIHDVLKDHCKAGVDINTAVDAILLLFGVTKSKVCSTCKGEGWYAEHAGPDFHDAHGECCGHCPIQVECVDCSATGKVPHDFKTVQIPEEPISDLPF